MIELVFWGVLALSFSGWGRVLEKVFLKSELRSSFALRASWGMAATICFGSAYLAVVSRPVPPAWWVWIALGLLSCVWDLKIFFEGLMKPSWPVLAVVLACALRILDVATNLNYNCYDDLLAYFTHIRMILDRGDLVDPFSLRRVASYGGQQILQSFFLLRAPDYLAPFFEKGLVLALCAALLLELLPREKDRISWKAAFLVILFIWMTPPHINIAPQYSGLFLLLGIFALVRRYDTGSSPRGATIVLSIAVAGFLHLRANYFLGILAFFGSLIVWERIRKKRLFLVRELSWAAVLSLILLLPGIVLLIKSSNTPFFPLIAGNVMPNTGTFTKEMPTAQLLLYVQGVLDDAMLVPLLVLAICTAVFSSPSIRKWILCLSSASLISVLVVAATIRGSSDSFAVYRYCYPFILTTIFFCFSEWLRIQIPPKRNWIRIATYLAPAIVPAILSVDSALQLTESAGSRTRKALWNFRQGSDNDPFRLQRESYAALQAGLPAGETAITMVEHPFLFDFSRNRIWSLDVLGEASPGHGLRTDLPPEKLDLYFSSLGLKYFVFEDPQYCACQYSHRFWKLADSKPHLPGFHKLWAKRHLAFFKYLEWKKLRGDVFFSVGPYSIARIRQGLPSGHSPSSSP